MLKSIEKLFSYILNAIAPLRSDFEIVKRLDEESINSLPKSSPINDMDWVHPLFQYKNNKVRAIVWELKYKDNTLPLEYIGKLIYEEIIPIISDVVLFNNKAEFLLIPLPITKERRITRGYNQSEYIARSIVENDLHHDLLYAPQWFEKIKETPFQSHSQTKEDRRKNLTGCFKADPRVEGKYIILIDDVITTGSTLSEARKELLSTGAMDVFAFTIAH